MKYRDLPSVNELLETPCFISLLNRHSRTLIKETLHQILEIYRKNIHTLTTSEIAAEYLADLVIKKIIETRSCNLKAIINATGTVLHTNLGRAPLPDEAIRAALDAAAGYCNLEFNLTTGKRGSRNDIVSRTICDLTGAEAAIAVNNNAGAVILCLSALAKNKEVIISRGELVEIGGGFRVPEIMEASGGILREVGTTNRTHLRDYENAINDQTGLLMKAHRSNFDIVGFSSSVSTAELSKLSTKHSVPVYYDLGSGCFFQGEKFGWTSPLVSEELRNGIDIVSFSGDKLLGGPQAGIIAGKKMYIDIIAHHPMARALRLDKVTLAALDATLKLYLEPENVLEQIPTLQALCVPEQVIKMRAENVKRRLKELLPDTYKLQLVETESTPGGGSLPLTRLPSWAISITSPERSATDILQQIRSGKKPVIGRIQKELVILDMRTVNQKEISCLIESIAQSLKRFK